MAERVETVRLTAQVSNYITGMQQAAKATQQTATAAQKLQQQGEAMKSVGRGLLIFGGVVAAGVAVAIKAFADFDAKMSQVKTLSGATSDEMLGLADAAKTAGQSIGLSAEQVADAEIELVKAGVSVTDIMGGALTGALQLAAAGQIDVADATEIATIALTQFHLAGKDIPHVADLLTAGADKALGGVQDLGEALKSGGLVAAQFGVSLDQTVGVLSAFANAGLIGETAGTDLRQLLLKLADPADETADRMKQLGINIYDTSGKFIGLAGLAGQLKTHLADLTEEQRNQSLAMIFGSRAIAGANVLYKEGAEGIEKWTDEVNDSGFAAHQAAGKMDNLNGDIQKLGAAFQTDLIDSGSQANNVIRGLVQSFTLLVKGFGDLPGPAQGAVLAVGAVASAVALTAGSVLTLIPRLAALNTTLKKSEISFKGAAIGAGALSAALSIALVAAGLYAEHQADMASGAQDFEDTLDQNTGAITEATRTMIKKNLADKGALEIAKQLKISQRELTDAVISGGPALDEINQKFQDYANFGALAAGKNPFEATTAKQSLNEINIKLKTGIQNFKDVKAATDDATEGTQDNTAALQDLQGVAQGAQSDILDLANTIRDFGKAQFEVTDANRAVEKSVDDAAAALKANGRTLDEHTEKGRNNASSIEDIAKNYIGLAAAIVDAGGSQDEANAKINQGRDAFIRARLAAGDTKQAAEDLADSYELIPSNIETTFDLNTTPAEKAIQQFLKDLHKVSVQTGLTPYALYGAGQSPIGAHKAAGGPVHGPGTATSDSIPARLSNGEYVVNAAATAANRDVLDQINYGGRYAQGGYVPSGGSGSVVNNYSVSVSVPHAMIGSEDYLAAKIAKTLQNGQRNGTIPSNWNTR